MSPFEFDLLVGHDSAHLQQAACKGRHGLFDARRHNEPHTDAAKRHTAATTICRRCPALEACQRWADTLTRAERADSGVLAGTPPPDTRRPTQETHK